MRCRGWWGRLRDEFLAWSTRDLAEEEVCYLFLDGWYPRVRIGKKRARVPVLVILAVCADGRRIVLDMRIAGQEARLPGAGCCSRWWRATWARQHWWSSMVILARAPHYGRNGLRLQSSAARITSCATCSPRHRPTCVRN